MTKFAALLAASTVALSGVALAHGHEHGPDRKDAHAAHAAHMGGAKLSATLSGASEVPPADADGSGSFTAALNPGHDRLCYEIKVDKIDAATAAHIHEGAAGVNGGPVVTLEAPAANGLAKACATVAKDVAMKIMQNPAGYYVNVHNAAYPGGAVRGQLTK